MNIATGLLVFVIAWWLFFFMMLPIGVRSHDEDDEEVVPGTVKSAPTRPNLGRKAVWTTMAASIVWTAFYFIQKYELISFRDAI